MSAAAAKVITMPDGKRPPKLVDQQSNREWLEELGDVPEPEAIPKDSAGFHWHNEAWKAPLEDRFVQYRGKPKRVYRSTQRMVLLALARHANVRGECWPKLKTMANATGLSRLAICRALTVLGQAGLVKRKRQRGPNLYQLIESGD